MDRIDKVDRVDSRVEPGRWWCMGVRVCVEKDGGWGGGSREMRGPTSRHDDDDTALEERAEVGDQVIYSR